MQRNYIIMLKMLINKVLFGKKNVTLQTEIIF